MAYTNSPMVAYTKLSPNHSGQRTHSIDRITPHCVVGQCSAEGLGDWFARSSTQASSNYGIDKDGRVGLYVEEKNRSWCSSSNANDQRAITIECASDTSEPYAFRDVVYQTLIKLCVDICKRNGKKKLLWMADKDRTLNYSPAADEMILTVHRWFANKSCPGNWMFARMGDLASKVTAQLGGNASAPTPAPTVSVPETDGEKYIWDTLMGFIKNPYGVAGLMGNLCAESGLKANNLQNNGNNALGMTDEQFTAAMDAGTYANFVHDGYGYGLAQWTFHTRKAALLAYAQNKGTSIGDLQTQLGFLCQELEGYATVLAALKSATSIRAASDIVLTQFERPADQGEAVQEQRAAFGQIYYNRYVNGSESPAEKLTSGYYRVRKSWADSKSQVGAYRILSNAKKAADANPGFSVFDPGGKAIYPAAAASTPVAPEPAKDTPFLVRVQISNLNIRTGPGTNYPRTGFTGVGTFTILEVRSGQGSTAGWGRLKSGAGWISLDFATRI
ncbi:MAG: N-acetylmuramoyl-L-alanine amidase [Oscillospiraceae bacterium]|nr:N-acetylmuramoyl-L-alanine amidase [Oscillospiraceae bacterium]